MRCGDAMPRSVFLGLVFLAFGTFCHCLCFVGLFRHAISLVIIAGSAAACLAWPLPQPWRVRPAPPLRTALLTAPGVATFTLSLLLAAVFGTHFQH